MYSEMRLKQAKLDWRVFKLRLQKKKKKQQKQALQRQAEASDKVAQLVLEVEEHRLV